MKYAFPVKLHRFTNAEFNKKKAKYVAKYGYTMNMPGLTDVLKFDLRQEPSKQELAWYKGRKIDELGMRRYNQIKSLMAEKKESFLRMMGSPNPTWLSNIGTAMTLLDDINDAAGTLSFVTRVAAHILPKTVGKVLLGPAGWALTAADITNLAMLVASGGVKGLIAKRDFYKSLDMNPFSKEARAKVSKRLKKIRPTKGEIIEGLQVTQNMFGIGLSLGPIVGAIEEAFTGPYRVLTGHKVKVKWPIPRLSDYEVEAILGVEAAKYVNGGSDELSDKDHAKSYMVAEMATHVLYPILKRWHPLDKIEGIENIIRSPRKVTRPSTKMILEDEGINPEKAIGHLNINKKDVTIGDLIDLPPGKDFPSWRGFASRNKHNYMGLAASQSANEFTQNAIALFEGEDQVDINIGPTEKGFLCLWDNRVTIDPDTPPYKMTQFSQRVETFFHQVGYITFNQLRDLIIKPLDIKLIKYV